MRTLGHGVKLLGEPPMCVRPYFPCQVHTHDGAAAVCMLVAYGSAKDRKRLIKAMKGERVVPLSGGCGLELPQALGWFVPAHVFLRQESRAAHGGPRRSTDLLR